MVIRENGNILNFCWGLCLFGKGTNSYSLSIARYLEKKKTVNLVTRMPKIRVAD